MALNSVQTLISLIKLQLLFQNVWGSPLMFPDLSKLHYNEKPQNIRNNSTFFLSANRENITTAQFQCREYYSATLLAIDSQSTDDFVSELLVENSVVSVLTAGFRNENGSDWYWLTNKQPFNYTNWAPGHPNPYLNCMTVGGGVDRYAWYSVPCSTKSRFCCDTT